MAALGNLGFTSLNGALINLWRAWQAANHGDGGPWLVLSPNALGIDPQAVVGPADVFQPNAFAAQILRTPVLQGYDPSSGLAAITWPVSTFTYLGGFASPLIKSWVVVLDLTIAGSPPPTYQVLAIGSLPDGIGGLTKNSTVSLRLKITDKNVNWP